MYTRQITPPNAATRAWINKRYVTIISELFDVPMGVVHTDYMEQYGLKFYDIVEYAQGNLVVRDVN